MRAVNTPTETLRALNHRETEKAKAKIKTAILIKRLEDHALGKLKDKMTDSQIKAADIVLRKVMSDAPKILANDKANPLIPPLTSVVFRSE